jgi:hypothetical protein
VPERDSRRKEIKAGDHSAVRPARAGIERKNKDKPSSTLKTKRKGLGSGDAHRDKTKQARWETQSNQRKLLIEHQQI